MSKVKFFSFNYGFTVVGYRLIRKSGEPEPKHEFIAYLVYNARNQYGYYTERKKQVMVCNNPAFISQLVTDMLKNGLAGYPANTIISWCETYTKNNVVW